MSWQDLNESTFKIVFIDPISGKELRSFEWSSLQAFPIEAIQYSPDGEQLVIFEFDKYHSTGPEPPPPRFIFLNPQNGEILHKFDLQDNNPALTFAYSPGGEWFAFRAWRAQRVDVIDTTDWRVKKTFKVGDGILRGVSIFLVPIRNCQSLSRPTGVTSHWEMPCGTSKRASPFIWVSLGQSANFLMTRTC